MECYCGEKFHATNQFESAQLHILNHIAESLNDIWETLDAKENG